MNFLQITRITRLTRPFERFEMRPSHWRPPRRRFGRNGHRIYPLNSSINLFSLAVADITVALLVMPFLMINDCKYSKAVDPLQRDFVLAKSFIPNVDSQRSFRRKLLYFVPYSPRTPPRTLPLHPLALPIDPTISMILTRIAKQLINYPNYPWSPQIFAVGRSEQQFVTSSKFHSLFRASRFEYRDSRFEILEFALVVAVNLTASDALP